MLCYFNDTLIQRIREKGESVGEGLAARITEDYIDGLYSSIVRFGSFILL